MLILEIDVSSIYDKLIRWVGGLPVSWRPDQHQVGRDSPSKNKLEAHCGVSAADLTVWIVRVTVKISAEKIYPNTDDDNDDGLSDLDQSPVEGENDLITFQCLLEPAGVGGIATVNLSDNLHAYAKSDKTGGAWPNPQTWDLTQGMSGGGESSTIGPSGGWLEGRAVSLTPQYVTLSYEWGTFQLGGQASVMVLPRPGDSEATLRISQKLRSGNGFIAYWNDGEISNWVYPVLEIKLAPTDRLKDTADHIFHLRVEEASDLHLFADKHLDLAIPINIPTGWYKWVRGTNGQPGQWVALGMGERVTDSDLNGASSRRYCWSGFEWNTAVAWTGTDVNGSACQLLGHNGSHNLSLTEGQVTFQKWNDGGWGSEYQMGPSKRNTTVTNVTITKVKTNVNEDYFIYDPSEGASAERKNPQFTFNIKDGVTQGGYQYDIFMRTTPETNWPTDASNNYLGPFLWGTATSPGTVTTSWNDNPANADNSPCSYTFDIGVWEVQDVTDWTDPSKVYDSQWFKNDQYLSLSSHNLEFVNDESSGETKARISYEYADVDYRDPYFITVDALDGNFDQKVSYMNGATKDRTLYENIDIYTLRDDEEAGTWRGIFMAQDDHATERRDHSKRRMVAVNAVVYNYDINSLTFMTSDYSRVRDFEEHIYLNGEKVFPQVTITPKPNQKPPSVILARITSTVTDPAPGIIVSLWRDGSSPGFVYRSKNGVEPAIGPRTDKLHHVIGVGSVRSTRHELTTHDDEDYREDDQIEMWGTVLGKARNNPDVNEDLGILPANLEYLQCAGVEFLKVTPLVPSNKKAKVPAKHQARLLYFAGHGNSVSGNINNNHVMTTVSVDDIAPRTNWTDNLDCFVIAACSVLNIPSITNFWNESNVNNGEKWASKCVAGHGEGPIRAICGYYASAPSDAGGAPERIAESFRAFLNMGVDWCHAWTAANLGSGSQACAMDSNTYYWNRKWLGLVWTTANSSY